MYVTYSIYIEQRVMLCYVPKTYIRLWHISVLLISRKKKSSYIRYKRRGQVGIAVT